jgi:hypothetical protein
MDQRVRERRGANVAAAALAKKPVDLGLVDSQRRLLPSDRVVTQQ